MTDEPRQWQIPDRVVNHWINAAEPQPPGIALVVKAAQRDRLNRALDNISTSDPAVESLRQIVRELLHMVAL